MNNRNILLTGFAAIVVVILAIIWWIVTPSWVTLYPNVLPNNAQQAILQQLALNGFDYKVDSKNIILVKSDNFKNIQTLLNEKGLPEENNSGLEIFTNSDYGLSDFAQNINYQRGMEEELSRTIKKIKGIKDARVHLTIKKDSLFEERKQKPKASVVVIPFEDGALTHQNIRSIQEIVAAAVVNLDASSVVVITNAGIVLSAGEEALGGVEGGHTLEEKYYGQVNELLSLILPKGAYKISVNVLIEQKKKVTIEENYFPDMGTGKGFLVKKRSSEVGVADGRSTAESNSNKTNDEEYVYSKERSEIVYPEKEIKKITVGLVISKAIPEATLRSIHDLIFNSLGMDQERGDSVTSYFSPEIDQSAPVNVPDSDEIVQMGVSNSVDRKESFFHSGSNSKLTFILMLIFLISSIIFMALYLVSRKVVENTLSKEELDKLVADVKTWVNFRD